MEGEPKHRFVQVCSDELERPAMGASELAGDRKAKTVSADRGVVFRAKEPVKDMRCVFRWNAVTGVGDFQHPARLLRAQRNPDVASLRVVLYSIGKEVAHDLAQPGRLAADLRAGGKVDPDVDGGGLRDNPGIFEAILHEIQEVHGPEVELKPSGIRARE